MTGNDWLRRERGELATDRILDAAAEVFAEQGAGRAAMGDVARRAGCSRATLYRYFEDRSALSRAYVHREARRVAREVAADIAGNADPIDRTVEAVCLAVGKVRSDPGLLAWFTPENLPVTRDLVESSEVIGALAARLFGPGADPDRAEWLVRSVISLVLLPAGDGARERTLVRRFVAPVLAEQQARHPLPSAGRRGGPELSARRAGTEQ